MSKDFEEYTGCGCILFVIFFNLLVGAVSFQYVLLATIGKDVPWYADVIVGLFLGEVAVPAAILCWFLSFFLQTPFLS